MSAVMEFTIFPLESQKSAKILKPIKKICIEMNESETTEHLLHSWKTLSCSVSCQMFLEKFPGQPSKLRKYQAQTGDVRANNFFFCSSESLKWIFCSISDRLESNDGVELELKWRKFSWRWWNPSITSDFYDAFNAMSVKHLSECWVCC